MEAIMIGDTLTAKSDQLNADDLIGRDITVRVVGVRRADTPEQPVIVEIDGGHRPWKPCKTMRRVLAHAWSENAATWIGRTLVLYRDASVRFGSDEVGGIRIRAMSDIPARITVSLAATKGKKAKHTVEVFTPARPERTPTEVLKGWIGDAMKTRGWTADQVAVLLVKSGAADGKAASVPTDHHAGVIGALKGAPPEAA